MVKEPREAEGRLEIISVRIGKKYVEYLNKLALREARTLSQIVKLKLEPLLDAEMKKERPR